MPPLLGLNVFPAVFFSSLLTKAPPNRLSLLLLSLFPNKLAALAAEAGERKGLSIGFAS
jgi:hypothetical protein